MDPDEIQEAHMSPYKAWGLSLLKSRHVFLRAVRHGIPREVAGRMAERARKETFNKLMTSEEEE